MFHYYNLALIIIILSIVRYFNYIARKKTTFFCKQHWMFFLWKFTDCVNHGKINYSLHKSMLLAIPIILHKHDRCCLESTIFGRYYTNTIKLFRCSPVCAYAANFNMKLTISLTPCRNSRFLLHTYIHMWAVSEHLGMHVCVVAHCCI